MIHNFWILYTCAILFCVKPKSCWTPKITIYSWFHISLFIQLFFALKTAYKTYNHIHLCNTPILHIKVKRRLFWMKRCENKKVECISHIAFYLFSVLFIMLLDKFGAIKANLYNAQYTLGSILNFMLHMSFTFVTFIFLVLT